MARQTFAERKGNLRERWPLLTARARRGQGHTLPPRLKTGTSLEMARPLVVLKKPTRLSPLSSNAHNFKLTTATNILPRECLATAYFIMELSARAAAHSKNFLSSSHEERSTPHPNLDFGDVRSRNPTKIMCAAAVLQRSVWVANWLTFASGQTG